MNILGTLKIYVETLKGRETMAKNQSKFVATNNPCKANCGQDGEFYEGQERTYAEIRGELTRLIEKDEVEEFDCAVCGNPHGANSCEDY